MKKLLAVCGLATLIAMPAVGRARTSPALNEGARVSGDSARRANRPGGFADAGGSPD